MTDELESQASGQEVRMPLRVFTNNHDQENLGILQGLLKMVIHTCFTGRLGAMQSKNAETGKVELIIVGVEEHEDGSASCYPLFSPILAEDTAKYLAPNGSGGYIGEEPTGE